MRKKLTAVLIFLSIYFTAFAETFVVTSNADSGLGSLREAIEKASANGINAVDTIIFNIADTSRAGRTIIPLTELPFLTSNLIIDGTTQNGYAIGKSDAKITLLVNTIMKTQFTLLQFKDATNVQIFGLFLFNDKFTIFSSELTYVDGIRFVRSKNIVIGKPGKGNYFRGLRRGILSPVELYSSEQYLVNSTNVFIQSNIFNNNEAGEPSENNGNSYVNPIEYAVLLGNTIDITLGGASRKESNTFTAYEVFIFSRIPAVRPEGNSKQAPTSYLITLLRSTLYRKIQPAFSSRIPCRQIKHFMCAFKQEVASAN